MLSTLSTILIMSPEEQAKLEAEAEAKLKLKYGNLPRGPGLLRKNMNQDRKYFDSADYNMQRSSQKPQSSSMAQSALPAWESAHSDVGSLSPSHSNAFPSGSSLAMDSPPHA